MARKVRIGYLVGDMPPMPQPSDPTAPPSMADRPTRFALLRAMRPHQWAKNLLVVIPALAAHRVLDAALWVTVTTAFAALSLMASGVYLVNDVADVEDDRRHPSKRHRPVASGALPVGTALAAAAVLGLAAFALAWTLPVGFRAALLVYMGTTAAYSWRLKRVVVLDVILLAALYTVRVVAGAAAVVVPLSRWFLAFSVFLFTSLALVKRAAEARAAAERDRAVLGGRGWRSADLPVLLAFGAASSAAAALVYCLYISGDDVVRLYGRPDLLWLGLPVILYWLTRTWLLAFRGEMNEDPVLFALRDRASWICLAAFGLSVWLAT